MANANSAAKKEAKQHKITQELVHSKGFIKLLKNLKEKLPATGC